MVSEEEQAATQTPDQVAATGVPAGVDAPQLRGGAAYSQLPGGIVDALRGGMPQGFLSAMLPSPQTNGQVYASALAGGVSGMTGQPNPVQQQYEQQVRMQQSAGNTAYKLMTDQQAREEKTRELQKTMSEGLLKSENPDAQKAGAMGLSGYYKTTTGQTIPPEWFAQSAKLSESELNQVRGDIVAGLPQEQILARNPKLAKLPPQWLQTETQVLNNPAMRKKLGYASDDELRAEGAERERKVAEAEVAVFKSKHKDIDDKSLPYVAQYVQRYGGIPLTGLDPSNPAHQTLKSEALAWAREQIKANDTAWQQLSETQRHNRVVEGRQGQELSLKERELAHKQAEGGGFGKPLSSEAAQQIVGVGRLSDAVANIDRIYGDEKKRKVVDGYIGPYASRTITAQRYAPGGLLGKTPEEVIALEQNLATLKNYTIKLITGAAMSVQEGERIMKELPDLSLPPDQFWLKYAKTKQDIEKMRRVVDAAIIRGDRRALAVMQEIGAAPPTSPAAPGTVLNPAPQPTSGWGSSKVVK